MNIQEVMKAGLPFRRRGWIDDDVFIVYEKGDIVFTMEEDDLSSANIDCEDILSEDWYIKNDCN